MMRAALLNGLCLIIALAVMLSAVPFLRAAPSPSETTISHTADAFAHAGLATVVDHGHSHDDDELDGMHPPGHGPEHKDHSHVTLGLTPPPASLISQDGKFVRLWEQGGPPSHLSFRLDRPPCPLSVA
jgi:hypothetical protein